MKKIISFVLAAAMLISLGITAFAADIEAADGSASGEVTATYVPSTSVGGTVFSVDVTWTNLQFTYNEGSEPTWDAEQHKYVGETVAPSWAESAEQITVTNHSNTNIVATASYEAETGFEAVTMKFDIAPLVPSAALDGAAHSAYINVTPEGDLPETATTATKIGTITVTIEEYETPSIDEMRTDLNSAALFAQNSKDSLGMTDADYNAVQDADTVGHQYASGNATAERVTLEWFNVMNIMAKYDA